LAGAVFFAIVFRDLAMARATMPHTGDKGQLLADHAGRSNDLELSRDARLHVLDADRLPRRTEDHMHSDIQDQMHDLEELRLPELQARFAEIVGEPTRTPNKQYLLRRIAEALESKRADNEAEADDADTLAVAGNVADEPDGEVGDESETRTRLASPTSS
jgi:hypothetical protein